MSSPGINPYLAPADYNKQQAIKRKQLLAQSLLEQGQEAPGATPYGGLRTAGNAILGAFLSRSADKDQAASNPGAGLGQNLSSSDPAIRQKAYQTALLLGIDPKPFQEQQAQAAQPKLLQNMQPQFNPVQSTPMVTPQNPANSPMRQAIQNAPTESAPSMQDALMATGSPELTAQLAPQILQQQMARGNATFDNQLQRNTKQWENTLPMSQAARDEAGLSVFRPIPQGDPAYAGVRPGTILGRNSMGAIKPLQESDMKSLGAMNQEKQLIQARESADIAKQNALYGMAPGGTQVDFTKPLQNNAFESVAQSIANYDRSEATALSRYPAPVRGQIQARVSAINPSYQQTNYNEANATKLAFAKGPQGQSVQSLNSTISHMDLMKQYVAALDNNDFQTANALKNAISTEFGGTAPTNAKAVAEILGPEMAKAVLPNGGTGPEREGFVDTLKQKASQGQLVGVLNTYQGLMAGQLLSLKKRYENIPGQPKDFESKFLLPETQQILVNRPEYHAGVTSGAGGGAPAAPPPAGGGQRLSPQEAAKLPPNTPFIGLDGVARVKH